jgi:YebC/PmpR family DNA-binding regulatory protein
MSGHSHWSTIQRVKQAEDAKRGKLFSKLSREITLAARSGLDPATNFKLRLAVDRAKKINMPKEKIEKAIKKGSGGEERSGLQEVLYEGFGPESVGIIVEALTDNRQRTTAEIRKIFERGGGSLAGPGAVAHQFELMGLIALEKTDRPQETILKIMDFGVEDIDEAEDAIEVYTKPEELEKLRKELGSAGFKVKNFGLSRKPLVEIPVKKRKTLERIFELMNALEEHPDVQATAANFDIDTRLL